MTDLPEHISIWGELADTDHELRHVDVRGVRTRVLRAGSGPDLVLLHGTGGHLEAYARDIAGLAADFRVTAYDMVGPRLVGSAGPAVHHRRAVRSPDRADGRAGHRRRAPVRRITGRLGRRLGRAPTIPAALAGSCSTRRATSPTSPR